MALVLVACLQSRYAIGLRFLVVFETAAILGSIDES